MDYHIRTASINDAPILAELGATTFYDTFAEFHTETDMQLYLQKAYDEKVIEGNLMQDSISYFIAMDQMQPIGYIKLIHDAIHPLISGRAIELEKIYVLKSYLDQKAGKALMDFAIEYAKLTAYDSMILGVWQENHRAVNFYQRYGFETFTTRTFQLGSNVCDDYLMKLDLHVPGT